MAGIWLPRQSIAQPRSFAKIKSSWVQKGLVAVFDLGQMVEVLSGARPTSITGTPTVGAQGRGAKFSGAGSVVWADQPQFRVTGDLSIFSAFDLSSLNNYSGIISKEGSTTTYMPYEWRLGTSATDSQSNLGRASAATLQTASHTGNLLSAGFSGTIGITHSAVTGVPTGAPMNYAPPGSSAFSDTSSITLAPADNGASVYIGSRASGTVFFNGIIYLVPLFNQQLSVADSTALIQNIWDVFAPEQIFVSFGGVTTWNLSMIEAAAAIEAASQSSALALAQAETASAVDAPSLPVTVYYPTGDVAATGWTTTSNTLTAAVFEHSENDATYITSPTLGTGSPAIMSLDTPLTPGTYNVNLAAEYVGTSGHVTVSLLDSSNTVLGSSSAQALSSAYAVYALPVTFSSGAAVRVQVAVST